MNMTELYESINFLLDTTQLLCQEIADEIGCDLVYVEQIVHGRYLKSTGQ
jgi:hypothetical protein